jgi:hypothetical protein
MQEGKMYGTHKDLAKVKYYNRYGLFLIMDKARVISNKIDWLKFTEYLERKYKNDNMKEFMLSDNKPNNWGYIGKHLVKIDYGN